LYDRFTSKNPSTWQGKRGRLRKEGRKEGRKKGREKDRKKERESE
jgi:hypothetical protein